MNENSNNKGKKILLNPGDLINHYEIDSLIKSGGQGDVYLALDNKLNRKVVVKLFGSAPADSSGVLDEARLAAKLNHPGIVTIYETGEYNSRPYIVMEYIEGRTLAEYIDAETFDFNSACDIAIQMAEAIKVAHQQGIIHRDLNPRNILIDKSLKIKILDFGLARLLQSREEPAVDRSGTLGYSSPETNSSGISDKASDLFSFGAVLYYLFTGQEPFTGTYEAAVIYSIANETPREPRLNNTELPESLSLLIMKLLDKKPDNRPESIEDVLTKLKSLTDLKPTDTAPPRKSRPLKLVLFICLIIMVAVVGYKTLNRSHSSLVEKKTLAVLPFNNLGSNTDEYFADGMTDALATRLGRLNNLAVISRASSMLYKNSKKNPREIGYELSATYLLTGTIQWDKSVSPGRVIIQAQLIDVASNTYVWTDAYEREISSLFTLQLNIADQVTNALQLVIDREDRKRLQSQPTENIAAYDFYLRGNEYYNRSWDMNDISIAIDLYEKAIAEDSLFALAYAALSRCHSSLYSEYYDRSPEQLELARTYASTAIRIDKNLAEAYLAMGYYYYSSLDYINAMRHFQIVEELDPNNHYLYNAIGAVYRRMGNMAEAVEYFKQALELDPRSYLRAFDVGLTYGLMRQNDKALKYLVRASILAPDWPLSYVYQAWLYILKDGDIDKANEIIDAASSHVDFGSSKYYWWLSRIIKSDYRQVIANSSPGTDSAGYFLHCAQMNRFLSDTTGERSYSDSALKFLESNRGVGRGQARYYSYLGLAYAGLRQKDSAIADGIKGAELLPTSQDAFDAIFLVANLAEIFIIFGEYDLAVDQLEHLMSIPGFVTPAYFKADPLWKPLMNNQRFLKMIKGVNHPS